MGKRKADANDEVLVATSGTLASANVTSDAIELRGQFNLELRGAWVGTVVLERAFDAVNFVPVTAAGAAIAFTGPSSEVCSAPEAGVLYRLRVVTLSSGVVAYRLSK